MKKESSHIEDKVKQAFVHQQRKAPLDVWDSISNSIDLTADENSIRESFKKQEHTAPDGIWDGINRQLIIDDVWTRIEIKENRRRRVGMIWWLAASVSVLLLVVGFMKTHGTDGSENDQLVASSSKKTELLPSSPSENEAHTKQDLREDEESNKEFSSQLSSASAPSIWTNGGSIHRQTNEETGAMEAVGSLEASYGFETGSPSISEHSEGFSVDAVEEIGEVDQMEMSGWTALETKRPSPILNSVDRALVELSMLPKMEEETYKWEVGLTAAPSNSWLLDNKIRSGFRRNSLVSNEVSGGLDLGLNVAFHPYPRSAIQLKYDFVSIMNQRFEEYQSGRLLDVRTQVRQQKVSLSYLHTRPNATFGNQRFMVGGGLFYAHITSVERTSANNLFNNYDLSRNNFGLNLQSGFQGNSGRLTYRYGIFSDIGLLNLTSPNAIVPKKFNVTNTFNIGAFGTISYSF